MNSRTRNLRRAKFAAISFGKPNIVNLFSRQTLSTRRGIQISARGVARQLSSNRNAKALKDLRGCLLSAFPDDRSYKVIRAEAASQPIRNAQRVERTRGTFLLLPLIAFWRTRLDSAVRLSELENVQSDGPDWPCLSVDQRSHSFCDFTTKRFFTTTNTHSCRNAVDKDVFSVDLKNFFGKLLSKIV